MAEDMLARGIAWDDLGENKSMIRGCGYNKSSWKRALAEGSRTPSATAAASRPTTAAPVPSTQPLAFAHDMSHASFTAIDALGSLSGRLDEYEKQACAVLRSYHVCCLSLFSCPMQCLSLLNCPLCCHSFSSSLCAQPPQLPSVLRLPLLRQLPFAHTFSICIRLFAHRIDQQSAASGRFDCGSRRKRRRASWCA